MDPNHLGKQTQYAIDVKYVEPFIKDTIVDDGRLYNHTNWCECKVLTS